MKLLTLLSVGVTLTTVLYSIWVGGDAWETFKMTNRYVAVSLPAATISIFLAVIVLLRQRSRFCRGKAVQTLTAGGVLALVFGAMIGIQTNPVSWNTSIGLTSGVGFALLSVALLISLNLDQHRGIHRTIGTLLAAALMTIFATSFPRLPISLAVGFPPDAISDAEMTQRGKWINEMSAENAVVASLYAGAPIYYAERSAIDLLGKSDSYVARKSPNSVADPNAWNHDFYPGHNKWDIEYSILGPRPDVILNYFGNDRDAASLTAAGYIPYCLPDGYPILVLASSNALTLDLISACPVS